MASLGGRLNFEIGYSIDKTSLEQIKNELGKVANLSSVPGKQMSKSLQEAQNSARTLSSVLEAAFNQKLGTVNLAQFNAYLNQSKLSLKQIGTELQQFGLTGQAAFAKMNTSIMTANTTITKTQSTLGKITDTFLSAAYWGAAYRTMNSMVSTIKDAYNYVIDLDTSLNRIRIVTGDSAERMEQFAKSANKAAQELGASTKAYADASLIFYEQGLSDQEVKARTDVTMKVANVTDLNAEEAAENLTAVWNGFKISTKDAESTIDQLAAVAANSASNLGELSTAMSKVASAASTMGVSTEQLTAMLATVEEATRQAPESIGTAYKTIFARIGDLKTDGVDEFGTSLGEVSSQMKTMGIDILDETGAMKDMGAIIEETASHWANWTREQKQAAAIAMAGKRQYNNLFALFENWDRYTDNLNVATNSLGTLQTQQDTFMESSAAKIKEIRAQWEQFYSNLIDSDGTKAVLDGFTQIVKQVNGLTTGPLGTLPVIFSGLALLLNGKISTGLTNFITGNTKIAKQAAEIKMLEDAIANSIKEINDLTTKEFGKMNETQVQQVALLAENRAIAELKKEELEIQKHLTAEEQENLNQKIIETGELQKQQTLRLHELASFNQTNGLVVSSKVKGSAATQKLNEEIEALKQGKNLNKENLEYIQKQFQVSEELIERKIDAQKYDKLDTEEIGRRVKNLQKEKFLTEKQVKEIQNSIRYGHTKESIEKQVRNYLKQNLQLTEEQRQIIDELIMGSGTYKDNLKAINIILKSKISTTALSGSIEKMTKGLPEAVMGFSSLSHAIKSINDQDLSPFERFSQTLLGLSFGLPMVWNGLKNLSSGFKSLIPSIQSYISALILEQQLVDKGIKKDEAKLIVKDIEKGATVEQIKLTYSEAAANAVETVTNNTETASRWAKVKALLAEHAARLGLAAAIAVGVVGLGILIYKIATATSEEEKHNEKLKENQKLLQQNSDALKEASSAYQDLASSIQSLKESKSALSDMVVGTEEWTAAVIKLNEQVFELIDKYPKLLDYMSQDENGIYSISEEGFKVISNDLKRAVDLKRADTEFSRGNVSSSQVIVNRDNLANKIRGDNGSFSFEGEISGSLYRILPLIQQTNGNQKEFENKFRADELKLGQNDYHINEELEVIKKYWDDLIKYNEEEEKLISDSIKSRSQAFKIYLTESDSQASQTYKSLNDKQQEVYAQILGSIDSWDFVAGDDDEFNLLNLYEGQDVDEDFFGIKEGWSKVNKEDLLRSFKEVLGGEEVSQDVKDWINHLDKLSVKTILEEQYGQEITATENGDTVSYKIGDKEIASLTDSDARDMIGEYLNKNLIMRQYGDVAKTLVETAGEGILSFIRSDGWTGTLENISNLTKEELENLNKTVKENSDTQQALEKLGLSVDEVGNQITAATEKYNTAKKELINSSSEIGSNYLESIQNESLTTMQNAYNLFAKATSEESQTILTDILKATGDKSNKLIDVLSKVDLTGALNIDTLNDKLKEAGISTDGFKDRLSELVDILNNSSFLDRANKFSVSNVASGLDAYNKYLKDIDYGKTISDSDFKKIQESMPNDAAAQQLKSFFGTGKDGKMMFTGDKNELQKFLAGISTLDLTTIIAEGQNLQKKFEETYQEGESSLYQFASGEDNEKLLYSKDLYSKIFNITKDSNGNEFLAASDDENVKNMLAADEYLKKQYDTLIGKSISDLDTDDVSQGIIQQMQSKLLDFFTKGVSGEFQTENYIGKFEQYQNSILGVNAVAQVGAEGDFDATDVDYQNARKVVLQDNLDLMDSSLKEEMAYEAQLKETYSTLGNVKKGTEEYEATLQEVAQTQFLIKTGVTALSKTWNNTYKDAEEGTKEWTAAIDESAQTLTAMFGQTVDADFVAENLDIIRKVANGDTAALRELQDALAKKLIYSLNIDFDDTTVKNGIENILALNNNLNLEFGASLKDEKLIEGIKNFLKNARMTAEQANEMFGSMSWSFDYEFDEKTGLVKGIKASKNGGYGIYTGTNKLDYTADSAAGLGKSDRNGSGTEHTHETIEKEEYNGDIYHRINGQIENIDRTLSRIKDKQDSLWGKDALKNYKKTEKAIENNIKLLKQREKLERKDLGKRQGQLEADYGLKFDSDGIVKNYTKVYDKIYNEYENMRKKYNAMSADGQAAAAGKQLKKDMENAKKRLSNFEKEVDGYDDIYNKWQDDIDKSAELAREKVQNALDKLKFRIEVEVTVADAERRVAEFKRNTSIADEDYLARSESNKKDYKSYNKTLKERYNQMNDLEKRINRMAKGKADKEFGHDIKAAREYYNQLANEQMDDLEARQKLVEETIDNLANAYSKLHDEFTKTDDGLKEIADDIEHYSKVTKLIFGDKDFEKQKKFFAQREIVTKKQLEADRKQLKQLQKERADYQKLYNEATNDRDKEKFKKLIDETDKMIKEETNNIQADIEKMFENVKASYENTFNSILKDFEDKVTNGFGFIFEGIDIELTEKYNNDWLDDIQRRYETNKLTFAFEDAAAAASSLEAQQKILAVKERELAILREQDKLSQYDIDRANAMLNLTLKEIALRDAENNKSKMMLKRDAQGNYSYQYVSDIKAINKAKQELEDAQFKVNELDQKRYLELRKALYNDYKDFQDKVKQLDPNDENYDKEVQSLEEEFSKNQKEIVEEYSDVIDNLMDSSLDYYNNITENTFNTIEDMSDEAKEEYRKWIFGPQGLIPLTSNGFNSIAMTVSDTYDKMTGYGKKWVTAYKDIIGDSSKSNTILGAHAKFQKDLKETAKIAGEEYTKIINGDGENAAGIKDVEKACSDLVTEQEKVTIEYNNTASAIESTVKWLMDFQTKSDNAKYKKQVEELDKLEKAWSKLKTTVQETNKNIKKTPSSPSKNTSNNSSGSSNGGGGGGGSNTSSSNEGNNGNKDKNTKKKKKLNIYKNPHYFEKDNRIARIALEDISGMVTVKQLVGDSAWIELTARNPKAKIGSSDYFKQYKGWVAKSTLDKYTKSTAATYEQSKALQAGRSTVVKYELKKFDTGGYTGSWNSKEGKIAMLHEKELVLNKQDTANLLNVISKIREMQIQNLNPDLLNYEQIKEFEKLISGISNVNKNNDIKQDIVIHADFPNVSSSKEIEKAFENLASKASQYAWSTKLDMWGN